MVIPLLVVLSLICSLLLIRTAIFLSHALGFLDHPSERKIHRQSTPLGGGWAVAVSLIMSLWVFSLLFPSLSSPLLQKPYASLLLLSGLGLVGGFIDDLLELRAFYKLLLQLLVVAGALAMNFRLSLFPSYPPRWFFLYLNNLSTIFWILTLTNALNIMDYFDGGCTGISLLLTGALLAMTGSRIPLGFLSSSPVFILLLLLLGGLAGCLYYNRPPARIFLGDSGSQFLGVFFSLVSLTFWTFPSSPSGSDFVSLLGANLSPLLSFLILFSYPLFEMVNAILLRLKEHVPIYEADNRHFFYILTRAGLNQTKVLGIIYLLTAESALLACLSFRLHQLSYSLCLLAINFISYLLLLLSTHSLYKKYKGAGGGQLTVDS